MNWTKTIRRTVLIVPATVVALAGIAYVAVHTKPVEHLILAKVVQVAEARTGAQVEIRQLAISWTHLGANLYGVTVYGKGGTSKPPLFQSAHLKIRLDAASLLLGRIGITNLVLDRPVVHFNVNKEDQTNLPKSPAATKSSSPVKTLLNLSIRHMAINNGQIYCNDRKISLSATLADFGVHVNFDAPLSEYKGSLGYKQGRITLGTFSPIEHSLRARFVMSRTGLTLNPLTVRIRKSLFTLDAKLVDYANPSLQGNYDAVLYTQEFAQIMHSSLLPAGEIMVSGTVQFRAGTSQSFLNEVRLDGRFHSRRLAVHATHASVDVNSLRGVYTVARGNLTVTNLQGDSLGGRFEVNSGVLNLTGSRPSRLTATWQRMSLQDAIAGLHSSKYRRFHVMGRTDGKVKMSWSKSIHDLVAQSHIKFYAQLRAHTAANGIPLTGNVDVSYNAAKHSVLFRKSRLHIRDAWLSLNGRLSKRSNLDVRLVADRLENLGSLFQAVEIAKSGKSLSSVPPNLRGSGEFTGHVTGSPHNPRIQGRLSAHDLRIEGTHWRSITANVNLSPSQIALKNGIMVENRGGEFHLNATVGLHQWSFAKRNPVSIEATASGVPVASLERLARVSYPVKGLLSARLSVQGTAQNPSGHGRLRIVKASAWNQPIERIAIDFRGNGKSIHSTARVQTSAGDLNADLTYVPQTRHYELTANTSGLQLNRIQMVEARKFGIKGILKLSARGRGTIRNPELSANLAISKLQVRGQSIADLQGRVNIAKHHADFRTRLAFERGTVQAKGQVALVGNYNATATLDTDGFPIGPMLATYLKTNQHGLKGVVEVHAKISGPLKDPARIEARVNIPKLNLAYKGAKVALVRALRLNYRNGLAILQKTELKGTGSDFILQGTIPVNKQASMNVAINGTVDLKLLQVISSGINSAGRVQVQLAARGNLSHPKVEGNIRVEKAEFSSASMPVQLNNVNGQIHVSGDRIVVKSLTGGANGGTLAAQGFVIYGKQSRFNLAVTANSVSVPYPQGLRTVVNCFLHFSGTKANSLLSGRVIIDQLSLTRQFELTSLMQQFSSGSSSSNPSPFEKSMKLEVRVQSAQTLRLASSQLSVRGGANLTLTGSLANPVVLGRATLGRGEIFFMGRRYEIQSGTFEFSNPERTNPIVNVYATTSVEQYKITMNFEGPVDRMRTSYTSDPPLPPSDIINLIAFGKTSQQAAASSTPGVLGAESVLAKGVASQVTGKIQKLAGISQLTINPLIGNGQQNPGAQISIQQRVTGRLLLTFSTDTNQTQNTAVQLQYRLSHSVSVSALRGQNGGYAIDIHLHKSF